MLRIGRKTFIKDSVIYCNGYKVFLHCSCWTVEKDNQIVNVGRIHTLEDILKWCMENNK